MKKDRKTAGKLTLNRETLRQLNDQHLQGAAGGTGTLGNSEDPVSWRSCVSDNRTCHYSSDC